MTQDSVVKQFYNLIRVSLDIETDISCACLTSKDWNCLFELSNKHAIVGVCFSGVSKLRQKVAKENTISPQLFMKWLAMSANIQNRNEALNKRCVELQQILNTKGFKISILKGQGAARLYPSDLRSLRQSGDIDVWIVPEKGIDYEEHFERVINFANNFSSILDFNKQHVVVPIFKDVETEVHFTPSVMFNPLHNARLQKWFADNLHLMRGIEEEFTVPTPAFNVVNMLQHCYNHLLFEGVGLRQVMDYYYVLKALTLNEDEKIKYKKTLHRLGLLRFASAMMWVLQEVFYLKSEKMICSPNEKEGRFFLDEIMTGGNFGQYGNDDVMRQHGMGNVAFFMARMKRNIRFIKHYPNEILWSPFVMVTHKYWKHKALKKFLKTYDIFYL